MLEIIGLALAIALIIEGLIPALFPNKWRAYVLKLAQEPAQRIRTMGLMILTIGVLVCWLILK